MIEGETPESSLLRSIGSDLSPVGEDLLDAIFDVLTDNELAKEIPIVGMVVGLLKTARSIRDYLFLKKIMRFLKPLGEVPQEERQQFLMHLEANSKVRKRFGETLLFQLEKADDVEKAVIIGLITKAHIEKRIELDTTLRLIAVVNRAFLHDLECLALNKEKKLGPTVGQQAYSLGLAEQRNQLGIGIGHTMSPKDDTYQLNELGHLLIDVALRDWQANRR